MNAIKFWDYKTSFSNSKVFLVFQISSSIHPFRNFYRFLRNCQRKLSWRCNSKSFDFKQRHGAEVTPAKPSIPTEKSGFILGRNPYQGLPKQFPEIQADSLADYPPSTIIPRFKSCPQKCRWITPKENWKGTLPETNVTSKAPEKE